MINKPLVTGIVGFLLGGIVASSAYTFQGGNADSGHAMTASIQNLQGDAYDEAFLSEMIEHHQGAIDMAAYAPGNAKHPEVMALAKQIRITQAEEIKRMQDWQKAWGYKITDDGHADHMH